MKSPEKIPISTIPFPRAIEDLHRRADASTSGNHVELCNELDLPRGVHLHLVFDPDATLTKLLKNRMPAALISAHPRRQRDFILGRFSAANALASAGFSGPSWLPIGSDKLPVWPRGWAGSISHAGRGAVAAVARDTVVAALGVDMEQLIPDSVAQEVRDLVASEDELAVLSSLESSRGITTLFSAKEALYKALFPITREFEDFSAARLIAVRSNELLLQLAVRWGPNLDEGMVIPVRYALRENYVLTAACLASTQFEHLAVSSS